VVVLNFGLRRGLFNTISGDRDVFYLYVDRLQLRRSINPTDMSPIHDWEMPAITKGLSKNRRDDGTTTRQDGASLPQLAAISSP